MKKWKIFAFIMLNTGVLLGASALIGSYLYDQGKSLGTREGIAQILVDLGDDGRAKLIEKRASYKKLIPATLDTAATLRPRERNITTLQEQRIMSLQRDLAKDPQNNIIKSRLASAYLSAKEYKDAIRVAKEVLLFDPDNYSTLILIAYAYLFDGDDNNLISTCEKILEKTPDFVLIREMLAQAYYRTGRYDKALINFKKVLEGNPNSRIAKSYLGIMPSNEQKQWIDEAAEGYKELAKVNPDLSRLFNLAILNLQRGDVNTAKSQLTQIVNLAPIIAMAENNLALITNDFDQALLLVNKAVAAFPENPYFLDTLGMTYLHKGDIKNALENFEKAYMYAKDNGEIIYHLGLAYYNKPDQKKAVKFLSLAVEKDIPEKDKSKALEILKKLQGY